MAYNFEGVSGAGKTSPRLEHDLLEFDIRAFNKRRDGFNLLFHLPPRFTGKTFYRRTTDDCRHNFLQMSAQTDVGIIGRTLNARKKNTAALTCSICQHHFTVVADYTLRPERKQPCHHDTAYPLHHWQAVSRRLPDSEEKRSPAYKYNAWKEEYTWACSAPQCPAVLRIRIAPPRLSNKQVDLLMDEKIVYRRGRRVLETDPEPQRFGVDPHPSQPCQVLAVLRTYLIHALVPPTGERRRIAARNKRFMLAFGSDCYDLLHFCGFEHIEEVDGDSIEEFWLLPDLAKTPRHFLEDVAMELALALTSYPEETLKHYSCQIDFKAESGIWALQVTLGSFEVQKDPRASTIDLEVEEHPHYASLGAVSYLSDKLILFAYERQCDCDREVLSRAYYLECLKAIGTGRESSFLQEECVKHISMGEYTISEIENAYRFFNIQQDQAMANGDDHIINVYEVRIDSAPLQKEQARHQLAIIGYARNSRSIMETAENKQMSYQDALKYIGAPAEASADVIEAAAVATALDKDKRTTAAALMIIGNYRRDMSIQLAGAAMESDDDAPGALARAYDALQIPDQNTSDESVFTYYQTLTQDAGAGSKDSYTKALRVIARARKSQYLFAKLSNPDADVEPLRSTAEEPVGLDNIGNTCYLNSLLQYYYTINAVRDIVMNFDTHRMPLDADSVGKKRVGGRAVRRGEIIRGQKFVEQLRDLYSNLLSATTQSVRPTQELAELTLVSEVTDEKWRRQSISSPPTVSKAAQAFPFLPASPPSHPPPPIPEELAAEKATETEDVVMLDAPDEALAGKESTGLSVSDSMQPEVVPDANVSTAAMATEPSAIQQFDTLPEVADQGVSAPLVAAESSPDGRPPLPSRHNKPPPIEIHQNGEDERKQKLSFGAQQDVTEVIGNVMFSLQCAIKPDGFDPKYGEQLDKIRETFFGTNVVNLKKGSSYDKQEELWSNLLIYPHDKGSRTIYEALDVTYDEHAVELDKAETTSFTSIKKLPPVLQIQIQRTAFDSQTQQASKNVNPIEFPETVYMDRYLDDEIALQRRKETWKWKARMREIELRLETLENSIPTHGGMNLLDSLQAAKTLIETDGSNDLGLDPAMVSALEDKMASIRHEKEALIPEFEMLKGKLREQFTDMCQHRYKLQAVFVHRGTNAFGHYWIYIYDFAKGIWREYNDDRVSIVTDTDRVYQPSGGATPYYLVYVREEDKNGLVEAVCRDLGHNGPQTPPNNDGEPGDPMDEDNAAEMGNGLQNGDGYEPHLDSRPTSENNEQESAWQNMQATGATKDIAQAS